MILRSDGSFNKRRRAKRTAGRGPGGGKKDARGRVCAGCRSFRERYRLQGNTRVCRNAGAYDEVKFEDGEAGEWSEGLGKARERERVRAKKREEEEGKKGEDTRILSRSKLFLSRLGER